MQSVEEIRKALDTAQEEYRGRVRANDADKARLEEMRQESESHRQSIIALNASIRIVEGRIEEREGSMGTNHIVKLLNDLARAEAGEG